jgi:hypothetical protein
MFDGPLQLRAVNVPAIDGTSPLLPLADRMAEVGNSHGRQEANDGNLFVSRA